MYKDYFKRLLDLIIAFLGLPIWIVIFLILSPIIYLTDKGPIFHKSVRVGKKAELYQMYKFRTMKVDAPDIRNEDGSTFNSQNDVRVTKVGRIIRKLSIDETSQIINVIKGEMSIIGPRPTLNGKSIDEYDGNMLKRLEVRPGLTGYSQAYFRNSISQSEKYKYDAYYAENVTFLLDIKIFLKTIKTILKKENIYNSNKIGAGE